METLDPDKPRALLNDYLEGMIAIAFEHHGTLDHIVGDALAATGCCLARDPLVGMHHRRTERGGWGTRLVMESK